MANHPTVAFEVPSPRVAFQGEHGAFSESAIQRIAGEAAIPVPCPQFRDAFSAVVEGACDAALIPYENTLHGTVQDSYDLLIESGLRPFAETILPIALHLISAPGIAWEQVNMVYSHPVALNQCRRFLSANPQMTVQPYLDTAGSVRMVIENRLAHAAAVASSAAARHYGGQILAENIQDRQDNATRFLLLAKHGTSISVAAPAGWKTLLSFVPDSLQRCLTALCSTQASFVSIYNRPSGEQPWQRRYFVELAGPFEEASVQAAIEILQRSALLTLHGSFAREL